MRLELTHYSAFEPAAFCLILPSNVLLDAFFYPTFCN